MMKVINIYVQKEDNLYEPNEITLKELVRT